MAYAIIKTGGKQYRVSEGDTIDVEKLDIEAGTETTLSDIIFFSKDGKIQDLAGVSVVAEVVAQKKAPKVIAFKYRRRKGYHRTVGHRRKLTQLRITSIKA
ncbi:MAG: large subunit ribosomal protein [Chthoniobacter sp.]|jgi:large subunit ribosomal protein L21|nr:large subunit ribosomal protein [Chthoniobacter sp.]